MLDVVVVVTAVISTAASHLATIAFMVEEGTSLYGHCDRCLVLLVHMITLNLVSHHLL